MGDSDDENKLVGSCFEPSSKSMNKRVKNDDKLVRVPRGFPNQPNAFANNCLLVSIAIGTLYHEAQAELDPKKRQALERVIIDINSNDLKKHVTRRNLAGRKILQHSKDLIFGLDNVQLEGPHTYKLAKELAIKHNLRIIVYKNNTIKFAFPRKYEGDKRQIALLETTSSYIDSNGVRCHVDFLRKPKRLFNKDIFQCPLCLEMKSPNRNHSKCVRKLCKFCRNLKVVFKN